MSCLLAIETSTEYCSVALWQDGVVSARCELVGQKHSEMLLAMLDELLKAAGSKISEIDGIAFGKGPGSFTGVRIACGVTQGLALGADLKVVGVCTLEALAEASGKNKVIAALDARMGEIYLAAYEKRNGEWVTQVEPCLCKVADAPVLSGEGWFGVGSGFLVGSPTRACAVGASAPYSHGLPLAGATPLVELLANRLSPQAGKSLVTPVGEGLKARYGDQLSGVDENSVPQASAVVRIGAREFAKGAAVDAALALPLYLRDKVALKTSERPAK